MGLISKVSGGDKMNAVMTQVRAQLHQQIQAGKPTGVAHVTSSQLPFTVRLDIFSEMLVEHLQASGFRVLSVRHVPGSQFTVEADYAGRPSSAVADAVRDCPFCAETIKAAAIICKHCQRSVEPVEVLTPQEAARRKAAEPRWAADPYKRHQLRWFDGTGWTDNVNDNGVTSKDPASW